MVKEYNEKYVDISFEELSGEVKTENNWDSSSWRKTDIIWNYEDVVSNTRTVVDMQDIKNKNKI